MSRQKAMASVPLMESGICSHPDAALVQKYGLWPMYAGRSYEPSSMEAALWWSCCQPEARCAACALYAGASTYRITPASLPLIHR